MIIQRRRALLAASTATAATLLSGCSFAKHPGPKGDWDRLEDGDLLLAVPKGWDRSVAQSSIWGTKWTDPSDKSAVLMTAQSVKAKDGYDALDLAMNAARAVTRGYQPVGSRTAVTNGSVILVQQQYQFTWPYQKPGSLWAISRESTICLVDFSGEKITSDQISTLGQWIAAALRRAPTPPHPQRTSTWRLAALPASLTLPSALVSEATGSLSPLPEDWTFREGTLEIR